VSLNAKLDAIFPEEYWIWEQSELSGVFDGEECVKRGL
jgi:hypothetical protein